MHTIYLVRRDSKPVYVGYTSRSLQDRWKQHIHISKNPKFPLHHAIKKHGAESFTIETLYESEDEYHTLNYMEHHYIWLYQTHGSLGGYNMTLGGEGNPKGLTEKERKERRKAEKKAWYEATKERTKVQRKAYYKAYWETNKDRYKVYRETNKEKQKAYGKAWQESNKQREKDRKKAWYQANKDKQKARMEAWRESNEEKRKAYEKTYYKANMVKKKAQSKARYEANKLFKTIATLPEASTPATSNQLDR